MKRWLSIMAAAGLLLFPIATKAADTGSQTSPDNSPPVAQTLVREGDFAIKLATDLNLGNPTDEAAAENMLATAGIAPVNGWISDYPVTPQIIGQLDDSIAKAAADGRLTMSAEDATGQVRQLAAGLNLPVPAGKEAASSGAAPTNPTVVNNYYYNEGPPIVTYYAPPVDYAYLYDWVPFPVFWFGFSFPGFFICHNFTTAVVVQPFLAANATFITRRVIVSNRFIDPVTRRVVRVDPVVRVTTGAVRPMTVLRAGGNRSFMTIADMRHGSALHGVSPLRTAGDFRRTGSFGSPDVRRSANSIFSRSMQAMNSRPGTVQRGRRVHSPMGSRGSERFQGSSMRGSGGHAAPRGPAHNFQGSGFARSSGPVRTFNGPAVRNVPGSAPRFANHGHWRG